MDPLTSTNNFHENGSNCFLESQSRKKETTINKIYIDPNDKRFKEAISIAKNMFIKRTRTLYNWLHPAVTRKHINEMVLQTWDKLPNEEKNKQIIQVLNDKHQQLKAQVNPQVFDLFQAHITSTEVPTQLTPAVTTTMPMPMPTTSKFENNIITKLPDIDEYNYENSKGHKMENINECTSASSSNTAIIFDDFDNDPELSKELHEFTINVDQRVL